MCEVQNEQSFSTKPKQFTMSFMCLNIGKANRHPGQVEAQIVKSAEETYAKHPNGEITSRCNNDPSLLLRDVYSYLK